MLQKFIFLISVSIIICNFENKCFSANVSLLESKLVELQSQDIAAQKLADLYDLHTNAPNAEIKSLILKACGSGLLYLGNNQAYQTKIRNEIVDAENFERSLLINCDLCNGLGNFTTECARCKGDGKCKNQNCRNGTTTFKGFDNKIETRQCIVCKGTGRCVECDGTGQITKMCHKCNGRGGIFAKSNALYQYNNFIRRAIGSFATLRRLEAERIAQEQSEIRAKEAELAAQQAAMIAAAREKERQNAIAEQQAAEQKQRLLEEAKYKKLDDEYLYSIINIEGDRINSIGFLCELNNKRILLSTLHVLLENQFLRLKTVPGQNLKYKNILIHHRRGLVAFELTANDNLRFFTLQDNIKDINSLELAVFYKYFGNNDFVSVRHNLQGMDNDRINISNGFIQENTGSPIISYAYGTVIGIATHLSHGPTFDWMTKRSGFSKTQLFGSRIDDIVWSEFKYLDYQEYSPAVDVFIGISDFVNKEVFNDKRLQIGKYFSDETKHKAANLLKQYNATPEWMRFYADEAMKAAHVCSLILR